MYLHNAYESWGVHLEDDEKFMSKLMQAFEFYEKKIEKKELRHYGMATWLCFRSKQEEKGIHLNL